MVNYTNSKVYKIWSTQGDKIYIGSTTKQYLSQRMDNHRACYKCWKDGKSNMVTVYSIFEEYGLENCFIELIEAKECKSKDELSQLEGKHIRELICVNRKIEGRTYKNYYEEKKEQILEQNKKYRKDNKQRISEQSKIYRQDNKEKLSEKKKEYYEENKEIISEYQKQYHEVNKEKLSEYRKQINSCECGGIYVYSNKSQHFKTIKHCQFIESQKIKPKVDEV